MLRLWVALFNHKLLAIDDPESGYHGLQSNIRTTIEWIDFSWNSALADGATGASPRPTPCHAGPLQPHRRPRRPAAASNPWASRSPRWRPACPRPAPCHAGLQQLHRRTEWLPCASQRPDHAGFLHVHRLTEWLPCVRQQSRRHRISPALAAPSVQPSPGARHAGLQQLHRWTEWFPAAASDSLGQPVSRSPRWRPACPRPAP